MTKFISKLNELEEARKKAYGGQWKVDDKIGQDVFSLDTRIVSSDPSWNYSPGKISCYNNLKFCELSANSMLPLIQAAREMYDALKYYRGLPNEKEPVIWTDDGKLILCDKFGTAIEADKGLVANGTLAKLESIFEKEK